MSRIGIRPIALPTGVTLDIKANEVTVKGTKGELSLPLFPGIKVEVVDSNVQVTRTSDDSQTRAYHGLVRSMLNNHIKGVSVGYKKTLKLIGTGYRATAKGKSISIAIGFSHPVEVTPDAGLTVTVEGNDTLHIEGSDKQKVGQLAADIRSIRPPEPYQGKGIRYVDEVVLRKQGKTAA